MLALRPLLLCSRASHGWAPAAAARIGSCILRNFIDLESQALSSFAASTPMVDRNPIDPLSTKHPLSSDSPDKPSMVQHIYTKLSTGIPTYSACSVVNINGHLLYMQLTAARLRTHSLLAKIKFFAAGLPSATDTVASMFKKVSVFGHLLHMQGTYGDLWRRVSHENRLVGQTYIPVTHLTVKPSNPEKIGPPNIINTKPLCLMKQYISLYHRPSAPPHALWLPQKRPTELGFLWRASGVGGACNLS